MQEARNTDVTVDIDSLINGAISGDADDFGRLYDLYVDRIYRHIYFRVGNIADTEDLTQQVFLKAWKAIGRYRKGTSPFLAWIMKISHNLIIDYYRLKKDVAYLDDQWAFEDSDTSPERLAEERVNQQQLRKVILRLPYDQQQVILMSFIEGFTYAEIASTLEKREGTIRVILHRALKKMKQIMESENLVD